MKLYDLVVALDGNENMELHIDGLQLHFTARNTKPEWCKREIESIRLDLNIYLGLVVKLKDVPLHVTYQVIHAPDTDGKYTPDYTTLISTTSCSEEADYIRRVEAANIKFAYNMVYVTRQSCGHFEIFQTPQNEYYSLDRNIELARQTAAKRKCTRCICGW